MLSASAVMPTASQPRSPSWLRAATDADAPVTWAEGVERRKGDGEVLPCVGLWTARRIAARAVSRLPENPEWNEDGLRMELVR